MGLRADLSFALLLGVVVSCKLAPIDGSEAGGPGAPCAENADCETNLCRTEGYCGQTGCGGGGNACLAGWTCETSRGDPIFGIGGGNTYCEPSCAACPPGTGCEDGSASCEALKPRVTVKGGPPKVGQLANLELEIDARGRPFTEVKWEIAADGTGTPKASPAAGSGTKLAITFEDVGSHSLGVTLAAPRSKPVGVSVPIAVCGDAGTVCSGEGSCCGGECALERMDVGGTNRRTTCVNRCPATCAPGHACREFDRFQNSSAPSGSFCLPELAKITIDYAPKAPTVDEPVTFTSTVTSPAGLKVLSYAWYVDDSGLDSGNEPTLVQAFSKSGTHDVALHVTDEAGQISKHKVQVTSCIPAGETCGFTNGQSCCGSSICIGSTCQ